MNIIVTGGAGFIGSHICELMISQGYNLTVIDDLSSGSTHNLKSVWDQISLIEQSVENVDLSTFKHCDAVIHLAAQVSVPLSISNFYQSSTSNITSSIKLIDFCASNNVPFIYASSAAVYGGLEFADDMCTDTKLLSPYAADKYAMELYAEVAHENHGLSSLGLRFFNVYGPRQNPSSPYSGVISKFLGNIFSGKDLTIYGGTQTRDFLYVGDVARIVLSAVQRCMDQVCSDNINVLTGSSVSINELSDMLIKMTDSRVGKTYLPRTLGDPMISRGATAKLRRYFAADFSKMMTLKEGLEPTVEYIRQVVK